MNLIALTPDQFTETATAWISSAVAVTIAITGALAVILPKLAALKQAAEELAKRQDRQAATQLNQAAQITQVALAVPPIITPSPVSPAPTAEKQKTP